MPLPKIRDGQKLSLVVPADVARRLKIEAMEEGTIPALIVLEALDQYWGGSSGASDPTEVPKDQQRRQTLARLLHHLNALIAEGKVTEQEVAQASGVSSKNIRSEWRRRGYVPASCAPAVLKLLASKKLPISRKL